VEKRIARRADAKLHLGFAKLNFDTDLSMYAFLAFWYFVGLVIALRIVRSPVGAIFRRSGTNPLRASALGHNITATSSPHSSIAAVYAGFAGGFARHHARLHARRIHV